VALDEVKITGSPPHRIARAGIAYVPSGRRIFSSLTVRQNLDLARRDSRHDRPTAGATVWTVERLHETFPSSPSSTAAAPASCQEVNSRC
jgi:branched-chain amino acid transport system ATP-binding protein